VNPWWWLPIGLAVWFAASVAAGLLIGRWLRDQTRAADEQEWDAWDLSRRKLP
jgi:anti-sigma factor RsiW